MILSYLRDLQTDVDLQLYSYSSDAVSGLKRYFFACIFYFFILILYVLIL